MEPHDAADVNHETLVSVCNSYSLFGNGFFVPCLSLPAKSPARLEAYSRGKNIPMAQEADFYSVEEAAKVLRIPVRRVFGMLCSGELEGRQDDWARWHIPASAVQEARRSPEPSTPGGLLEEDAESRFVTEDETRVLDAAETTILANGGPFWEPPPGGADSPGGEETTHETGEALIGGSPASSTSEESSNAETIEGLPYDDHQETTASNEDLDEAPNKAVQELVEQLAAAAAKTRELRDRLELAEATEAALRESLEREYQRADRESAQAELQHKAAAEQLEEEPEAGRDEGFWRSLFRG